LPAAVYKLVHKVLYCVKGSLPLAVGGAFAGTVVGHCCEFVANTVAATGRSSRLQMRGVRKLAIGVDNVSTCHKGRRCATIRWREGRKVHGIGRGLEKSLRGRLRAWVIGVALLGTSVCDVLSEGVRHECRLPLQSCVCHGVGNPCIVHLCLAVLCHTCCMAFENCDCGPCCHPTK
jgi:hypothetical protein